MKHIPGIISFLLILTLIILAVWSCNKAENRRRLHPNSGISIKVSNIEEVDEEVDDKLEAAGKLKIKPLGNFDGVYIYDIDAHIYICNQNGGIVHSESCPCKKITTNTYTY